MASKQLFVVAVVLAAIVLPRIASATEFIVGDDSGWRTHFDYHAWAKGKTFHVGDKLVFKYPEGVHTVFKVNGTAFKDCTKPPKTEALTSGNDVITLATPGRKWYICGVGKHCKIGQKLFISVLPQSLAPSPAPQSPLQ